MALGRKPATSGMDLERVGVEQGRLAAGNAFARSSVLPGALGGMSEFDDSVVPWVTFTDPEVGRVGMTEQQAYDAYGERARVAVVRLDEMDRTRTSAHTDGYLKLIAGPRPVARHQLLDRVIGVTAVMPAGGEITAIGALAMHTNMLAELAAQRAGRGDGPAESAGVEAGRSAGAAFEAANPPPTWGGEADGNAQMLYSDGKRGLLGRALARDLGCTPRRAVVGGAPALGAEPGSPAGADPEAGPGGAAGAAGPEAAVTVTAPVSDESRTVAAVLRFASRHPRGEERTDPALPLGFEDFEADDIVGLFLAAEHDVDVTRVSAYKSLGRSRGLPLSEVLRACFRGELRPVVELPAIEWGKRGPGSGEVGE